MHSGLYALPDGKIKQSGSYSARKSFKHCKRQFQLTYVLGWRSKKLSAATYFGHKMEDAVRFHVESGGFGGVLKFAELWHDVRSLPEFPKLEYTNVEESWENLLRCGVELMQLFEIRFPRLPMQNARFQVPLSKEVFPGTSYAGIRNTAILDIICETYPHHAMLPSLEIYPKEKRRLLIDIKTASKDLAEMYVSLDPQLIEYAWEDGTTRDVAFLWFVKKSHGMKCGSRVTLLTTAGRYVAGSELFVLDKDADHVWVATGDIQKAYDQATNGPDGYTLKGKAAEVAAKKFLDNGQAVRIPSRILTKQRLQFAAAHLPEETVEEMGRLVGLTTVEMVVAHEEQFYPMEPGVRFPDEKCPHCDMRFICGRDSEGRDKFLTRIGEEWLDQTIEE